MTTNVNPLIKNLFQKSSLNELTKEELLKFHLDYPFSSIGSFLYAKKLKQHNDFQYRNIASDTSLYFNNQRWLYYLLNEVGNIDFKVSLLLPVLETIVEPEPKTELIMIQTESENNQSIEPPLDEQIQNISISDSIKEEPLLEFAYQQYHTVDYFASQGIKLGQIDSADKLGQKVKTFTEWLKTMKSIQIQEEKNHSQKLQSAEEKTQEIPEISAIQTIVLTETMAEIYQKQGLNDKAIEVYEKLSLQNPVNSHIFADRIKALKDKKP